MVSGPVALARGAEDFSFEVPPRTPTKSSWALPPLPTNPSGLKTAIPRPPSPRSPSKSNLGQRTLPPVYKGTEEFKWRKIHDYYGANLDFSLDKRSQKIKSTSNDSRRASYATLNSTSSRNSKSIRLSSGSVALWPTGKQVPNIPADAKSRALWFLETIGTAPSKTEGTLISPNIYLLPKFWDMNINDSIMQQLDLRIKVMKKILKCQPHFDKELVRIQKNLAQAYACALVPRRHIQNPHAPPTPPMDRRSRVVSTGSITSTKLDETMRSVSTGFRSLSLSQSKSDVLHRYAELAYQLYEAVKKEFAFGLETAFMDCVLDTLVPGLIDDIFDLHGVYMDAAVERLMPHSTPSIVTDKS